MAYVREVIILLDLLGDKKMDKSKTAPSLSKRQFLGAAVAASAVSISPSLMAGNQHGHHKASYSKAVVKAAEDCVSVGQACKAHIYQTLKSNDLDLAECLMLVRDTIAACATLVEIVTNGSVHGKAMAKVCISICKDCRDECNKHVSKHKICKDMADSCDDTIDACLEYIG